MPMNEYRVEIKVTEIETDQVVATAEGSVPSLQGARAIVDVFSAIGNAHLLGCSWGRQNPRPESCHDPKEM